MANLSRDGLGTPASGDLKNCGGLPIAGIAGTVLVPADIATNDLTTGESSLARQLAAGTCGSGNNNLRLCFFTAKKSETITQLRVVTVTAQVGATLCRIGVYSVDGSGNLALIASTPSDTAQWIAASTAYTKSLSASFSKVRGNRYAVGWIVVGASTVPTFSGDANGIASELGLSPRLSGFVSSQTDLPSTVTAGSISDSASKPYVALLP